MATSFFNSWDSNFELPQSNIKLPLYSPEWAENKDSFSRLKLSCLASYKHPCCEKYLNSIASVSNERRRQCQYSHPWVIHPFSATRFYWESFMTVIYALSFIIIPFMTSFIVFDFKVIRLDRVSPIFYLFFWVDISMNFITGVHGRDKKIIILDQREIIQKYISGFFSIDLLTSLPYDHITYYWRKLPGPKSSFFVALINVLPMLKLIRYVTFDNNVSQLFEISDFICRISKILLISVYLVYWFTCLCYLVPVLVVHFDQVFVKDCDCWLINIIDDDIPVRFKSSFFIILQNFMTTGIRAIEPEFTVHTIICTLLMILGRFFWVYIIVLFFQIYNDKNTSQSGYQETMSQILAYTRQKQMPHYMRKRIESYYSYRFKNSYFREKKILSNLSEILREEITIYSCRRLIENLILFRNLPKDVITSIVSRLKFEIYLPNDLIFKAGNYGDCMFFLSSGTVALFTPTGKEICHLTEVSYFGEVSLLVKDQRRIASVIAIEVCEVYRLDRRDFRKYVAIHNDLFQQIERMAMTRMEKAILIEEQYKRNPLKRNQRSICRLT
ncbi:Similar to HCN1: Potassium/sodium hyperpolarization-activated cyclic nucleotide-gated channel 1 (Oryctolagus cuniculus) [Cotesia congregata]|uniref:Similar to HCN1: Potassium/sodium hyperpolarization-activated cyclic nucleotide-gated channel 1 (Oryctolagus cuniculus) n=1 Tax=Cotesia congregata TaxID=51543 RepID=A0A8J2HR06_COTCN|nr:Similar to HCN1: Potassium/sodium hyperpolarization-activated cyclic nucleotide-gated channel 1 (Oryctolagus cuniculus) [Cotesia congregata]